LPQHCSQWKQGHSDSIPLVTSDSKRIDFWFEEEEIRNKMADISQMNMQEIIRVDGKEVTVRIMKVIMKNNATMLKLQKQIVELQVAEEEEAKKETGGERTRKKRV